MSCLLSAETCPLGGSYKEPYPPTPCVQLATLVRRVSPVRALLLDDKLQHPETSWAAPVTVTAGL